MHRAVWGPGVETWEQALLFTNELMLAEIVRFRPSFVLDLGCGVGGTLSFLAERYAGARYGGITVSKVQAAPAQRLLDAKGLSGRCRVVEGDFLDPEVIAALRPPGDTKELQLAYAMESFVHARDSQAFFRAVARGMKPGDQLIVCDDFLASDAPVPPRDSATGNPAEARAHRRLQEYTAVRHIHNLVRPEEAVLIAATAGYQLRAIRDLTPYLQFGRPRDLVIRALAALGRHLSIRGAAWENMVGGDALQACLRAGWVKYCVLYLTRL